MLPYKEIEYYRRAEDMLVDRKAGMKYTEIAVKYRISATRAQQVINTTARRARWRKSGKTFLADLGDLIDQAVPHKNRIRLANNILIYLVRKQRGKSPSVPWLPIEAILDIDTYEFSRQRHVGKRTTQDLIKLKLLIKNMT